MDQLIGIITEKHNAFYIGALHRKDGFPDIKIDAPKNFPFHEGDVVAFTFENQLKINEKIGHIDDKDIFFKITLHRHNIPYQFPKTALTTLPSDDFLEKPNAMRVDLRSVPFVTIDGEDAKDFDDAVFAEEVSPTEWKISVAIADVSHYVKSGTSLDQEALKRGNSVYLPNHVVPMLPEKLSNDLCSLKPNVDRYVLCVNIVVDELGKIKNYRFMRAVINSKARLTYNEVQKAIEGNFSKNAESVQAEIQNLYHAYKLLKKSSSHRGTIELTIPEYKIRFDDQGSPIKIEKQNPMVSQQIIEEMMILANTCAGKILSSRKKPTLYRIHPVADETRVSFLSNILKNLGIPLPKSKGVSPHLFNKILKSAQGTPLYHFIQDLVLRSQSQASYSPQNVGHFGLSLQHYCHFTSPIRRYADLIVHRCLIEELDLSEEEKTDISLNKLIDIGEHISKTERVAMKAERETTERFACFYLRHKEGDVMQGRITGTMHHGIFILLEDYGVEGYIPVSKLDDDYYFYEEDLQRFIGKRKKNVYQLGQTVTVELVKADFIKSQLQLKIQDSKKKKSPKRMRRK
jgi:ribonuclease R